MVKNALAKCYLELPATPKSVSEYNYSGKVVSTAKITNITYEFECDNDGYISLTVYFSGQKTYDSQGNYNSDNLAVGWKVFAPDGSVMNTSTFYSPSLTVGETFTNKSVSVIDSWDDATAGRYRLEIIDSK